jgi:hypothetical protein
MTYVPAAPVCTVSQVLSPDGFQAVRASARRCTGPTRLRSSNRSGVTGPSLCENEPFSTATRIEALGGTKYVSSLRNSRVPGAASRSRAAAWFVRVNCFIPHLAALSAP